MTIIAFTLNSRNGQPELQDEGHNTEENTCPETNATGTSSFVVEEVLKPNTIIVEDEEEKRLA